ncbi:MAG: hypothetical protein JXR49_19365 [Acidobacteria bacterium]|nr:hypothetical protein [Acidobacteriota bacterium]
MMPCRLCGATNLPKVLSPDQVLACPTCLQILCNSTQQQILEAYNHAVEKKDKERARVLKKFLFRENRNSGKSPVRDNQKINPLLMRVYEGENGRACRVDPPANYLGQRGLSERLCEECKEPFFPKRADARYCSSRCQKRARRKNKELTYA